MNWHNGNANTTYSVIMNKFYVNNTAIGKVIYFDTVNDLVNYLGDVLVPQAFKQTKAQYKQHLADLGHGLDDDGVVLTRAVAESFDIGIWRDGKLVRTDVHTIERFQDSSFGD